MTTTPFTKKTFSFLSDLKKHNDRDWFAANKSRYEADVLAPALSFVESMRGVLAKHSRYLLVEPKRMGGSIMRIYRDTRFSHDKTPYKTNVGIHFRHALGGDVHAPGLYVHLEPKACFLAAGIWMPPAEPLRLIRQSIADDPKEWFALKRGKRFAASFVMESDSLKTAPKGFDKEHVAIEDLRRKSFAGIKKVDDSVFLREDLVSFVADSFRDAKPLMKFLCDALQQPY